MSKANVTLDESVFVFETVMRVRSTEIDMGQHLTIEALTSIVIESRARFLFSKGIKDINADYQGLITNSLVVEVVSFVHAREELLFEVGVSELTDNGGDLLVKVSRMYDNSLVAKAKIAFENFDYRLNKKVPLSVDMKEALDLQPFEL